jgi:hypothetical protein
MEKLFIENLVIEVTRRCNMSCSHCMRGDAQCIDIDSKYIDNLFSKIDRIGTITFTGGEPSIVPEKIREVLTIAQKYGIEIGSFYIATNCKEINKDFLVVLIDLYTYCEYKEGCMLQYSNDKFHDDIDTINIEKLKAFSFTSAKDNKKYPLDTEGLLNQGRAFYGWGAWREVIIYKKDICDNCIEGNLYLNAIGNILPECDLSFDSQDNEYLIICNVRDDDVDIIEAVKKYNARIDYVYECESTTELTYSMIEDMEMVK